jgi:serine/threonine protein kinase/WD40 repeat protein
MDQAPKRPPPELLDRVASLLEEVLAADSAHQTARLDELCASHPECAQTLRIGFGSLQNLDLLQVGQGDSTGPTATAATDLPRTLGPFRLLELLGAGGMGAVYRAEDLELKRQVALKLVRGELLASSRTRSRFQRESEALARLDHPGLCTVYRAGTTDGQPWIAMRLVRGTTLASLLEQRLAARRSSGAKARDSQRGTTSTREELQATLRLFEKVARALGAAHAAGIVHRDIKPGNLVLTEGDEPVVIDFGLVHFEDSQSHMTLSGDQIGTPAYMAPEQVVPAGREPGPRTDVYALGVTLFEALTQQSPYPAHGREELFHCIVRGERLRLRQVRRDLPIDVELVLEKALDVDPARRYASMAEFADDLRRLIQHEPPLARRIGPLLRLRRWCQRNPVAATALSLLSLGLGTALVLERGRRAAERHSWAMAYGNLAGKLTDEHPEHAVDLALLGRAHAPDAPESLGMLLSALQAVQPHEVWPLPWERARRPEVRNLVVAPDGSAALVLGFLSDNEQSQPVLWRASSPQPVLLPVDGGTLDADWSSDGKQFLTTGPRSRPQLWSVADPGQPLATFEVPSTAKNLRVPRGRFLHGQKGPSFVFACSDGTARICDLRQDRWIDLQPQLGVVRGLDVSADGAKIALGEWVPGSLDRGRIVLHETAGALAERPGLVLTTECPEILDLDFGADGSLLLAHQLKPHRCSVWSPKGDKLAAWGTREAPATWGPLDHRNRVLELRQDSAPRLWRLDGEKLALDQVFGGHDGKVVAGNFAADGRVLTLGVDGTARIWTSGTDRTEVVLRGFDHELRAGAFLGEHVALLVTIASIHRFDLRGVAGPRLQVGNFRDLDAHFLGDGWPGRILTADDVRRLSFHDQSGRKVRELTEKDYNRRAGVEPSPSGKWLATTSVDRLRKSTLRVYRPDLSVAHEVKDLPLAEPVPIWGPDDQLLLVDSIPDQPGASRLLLPDGKGSWQDASDDLQQQFVAATAETEAFAFHAQTATLAVARPGGAATLFHWTATPPALQPIGTLLENLYKAHRIAFAPDGQSLLLACRDRTVRRVDRSGRVLARITGHIGSLVDVGFSSAGDRLLVAAAESGVTIHALDGALELPIRPLQGAVTMAVFHPDGQHVLYGTTARTTCLVPIVPAAIENLARSVVRPRMSEEYRQSYRTRIGDPGKR